MPLLHLGEVSVLSAEYCKAVVLIRKGGNVGKRTWKLQSIREDAFFKFPLLDSDSGGGTFVPLGGT